MKKLLVLVIGLFLTALSGPVFAGTSSSAADSGNQQQKQVAQKNGKKTKKADANKEDRLWRQKAKQDVAKQAQERRKLIESGGGTQ